MVQKQQLQVWFLANKLHKLGEIYHRIHAHEESVEDKDCDVISNYLLFCMLENLDGTWW